MNRLQTVFSTLLMSSLITANLPAQSEVPLWNRFETTVQSAKTYGNPLIDIEVTVEFTAPSGEKTVVPAFWDYGSAWKARYMPDEVGSWRYRWTASDTANSGLHGPAGTFECRAYEGENPLYRHGGVDVAQAGRYFAHSDGTPFLWLGDTAWNGALLASATEWTRFLANRAAKHFSVIQFVMTQWRSAAGDEDGRPAFVIRNDKLEVDPIFFQRMDERVNAINDRGLLAAPVLFWTHGGHPNLNPGQFLTVDQLATLGRYMVGRYGAHHVAWILAGDGAYDNDHAGKWRQVGRALFGDGAPGIRHPVTMHAGYWCAEAFAGEKWFTFNGYQSGHNRTRGLTRITQEEPTQYWKSETQRPVLNLEPSYEAHRNRAQGATDVFDDLDVRRTAWHSMLASPPAGLTYGVHGIWGWHPRAVEPMTHPGTGVGPAWYDAMNLAGSAQLKHMVEFFEALDWQDLRPAHELLASQPGRDDVTRWVSVSQIAGGGSIVAYSGAGDAIEFSSLSGIESVRWFSPRSGEWIRGAKPTGKTPRFEPPSESDWVLLLTMARP